MLKISPTLFEVALENRRQSLLEIETFFFLGLAQTKTKSLKEKF